MTYNKYLPRPEDKFIFGLSTVGNHGVGSFGVHEREKLQPTEIV